MKILKNKYILFLFVFLGNLILFSLSDKHFKTIDTIGTRLIPISILNEFNMDLDEFFGSPEDYLEENLTGPPNPDYHLEVSKEGKRYYHLWIITVQNGKFYTSYPIVVPILNLPFYIIAKIFVSPFTVTQLDLADPNSWINKLDNFISAFWTALGGLFLFLIIYRDNNFQKALVINLIYCLATPAFSLLSHNTWQHTVIVPAVFLLLLLIPSSNKKHHYLVGLLLGLLPFIRPTGIFFYPLVFLAKEKNWKEWVLGGSVPVLLILPLHILIYSHPLGGYHPHSQMIANTILATSFTDSFLGLLFSPSRGLLIFLSYLILVIPAALLIALREFNFRMKVILLILPFLLHLSYYTTYGVWHGGWSYGPRFLSDNLPIFMILLFLVADYFWKNRPILVGLGITIALSFLIHLQPALSKEFHRWEQCYRHPESYYEKVMNWSNPVFLARFQKLGLAWKKELVIDFNDLCYTKKEPEKDGTIQFSNSDIRDYAPKLDGKYILFYENEYYLPEGKYQVEILDQSSSLFFGIQGRRMKSEHEFKNGQVQFSIEKKGNYSFSIFTKEDSPYIFRSLRIRRE